MSLLQRFGLGSGKPTSTTTPSSAPRDDGTITASPATPLVRASSTSARDSHKHNPFTVWAARALQANQADRSLACHRIWADLPELGIKPKFQIAPDQAVFAMGSCFAREVEDALVKLGFDVPTHCDVLFDAPLLTRGPGTEGTRPRAYLNRYNSMSMRDEFRHLLGLDKPLEQGLLTYGLERGGTAELHYTQSLPQVGLEGTLERRRLVRNYLGPRLRASRLFVLTLGLAECWYDTVAGRYLNNTPGPRVLATYGDQLEVHLTTFSQHLAALQDVHRCLSGVFGDDFKIVVTVSPVPLERTFLEQDVVVTNSYSKSMLRAVAQEFAVAHGNVDYFPSYELVTVAQPQNAWAWDYRHVKPQLVGHIMGLFRRHYIAEPAA
ncbi:MAG TPA: GSCFA domain-containing protein [Ideonella sp.]|nr:GSCFA domain-containing protein [Ideonella sp.]